MTKDTWDKMCGYHTSLDAVIFAVNKFLRTPKQRREIEKRHLSVKDILTSSWRGHDKFCKETIEGWNKKLGFSEFTLDATTGRWYHLWE